MSKLQEKLDFYAIKAEKLGVKIEADLFKLVTKGLGPSIYKEDAELVSCSEESELETVKKNFLIKKLELEDGENLDAAIKSVCEKMGTSNTKKYRAIFYYLLVKEFGAEAKYEVIKDENEEKPKEKKPPVKAKKEVIKEEVVETVKEAKKPVKKEAIKEEVVEVVKEVKMAAKAKKEEVKEDVSSEDTKEVVEIKAVDPKEFLADFDWQKYEEGIEAVDQDKLDSFNKALENTIGFVEERQVIDGTVVRLTDREAIIDINSKSEGVISLNEFRYNPSLKVGDVVEVKIEGIGTLRNYVVAQTSKIE